MDKLSFQQLRKTNVQRCEVAFHPLDKWNSLEWSGALAGEAGEVCNEAKKLRRLDDADKDKDTKKERKMRVDNIAKELADVVCYADLLAAYLQIDLGKAVRDKFNEVSKKRKCNIVL